MMIKSIAAAGAIGVGLGLASLVGAGTASADCSTAPTTSDPNPDFTPPLSLARVQCVTNANIAEFQRTTSPQYNLDVLVNGQIVDGENTGLGLKDQVGTFQSSVGDFLNGPREPDTAPPSGSGF